MMKNNRHNEGKKITRAVFIVALAGAFTLPLQGCNEDVPVADPFGALATRVPVEALDVATKKSVIVGGRLYDNWLKINNVTKAENNLMAKFLEGYPKLTTGEPPRNTLYGEFLVLSLKDQYRCTTCHGFNYSGSEFFPIGVMDAADNKTVEEIQKIISEGISFQIGSTPTTVHAFSGDLNSTQIKDLATFVKYGVVNIEDYIYGFSPIHIGKGDAVNGRKLYEGEAGCSGSSCHGSTGKLLNLDKNGDTKYVGTIGQDNPAEMLHQIRFGQSGSKMPSIYDGGLTTQNAADIMTYTQQLSRD